MEIINQCRVDFQYCYYPLGPIIAKTILSNQVKTFITERLLNATKKVDKAFADLYDIITYTIEVTNKSFKTIKNIFFQDSMPKGLQFIDNSVEINGVKKSDVNPNAGFNIDMMKSMSVNIISFKVVITSAENSMIENSSTITYDYIYNVDKPPTKITVNSNKVTTTITKALFKQIVISNSFNLRNCLFYTKEIEDIQPEINIIETKIIKTPVGISAEGIKLTGYKILIMGSIKYKFIYKHKGCKSKYKTLFTKGFSADLVVPVGIQYCNKPKVSMLTEDISKMILTMYSLTVSISCLVSV